MIKLLDIFHVIMLFFILLAGILHEYKYGFTLLEGMIVMLLTLIYLKVNELNEK